MSCRCPAARTLSYFVPSEAKTSYLLDDDPAKLIPVLLDRLVLLGDLAKQISRALGGNGHRADEIQRLLHDLGAR